MTKRLLGRSFFLLWVSLALGAQDTKHFLIRIEPVRATFNEDATPAEAKVMGEHFDYLKGLLKAGKLVVAGPAGRAGERSFGLIVVEVADEAEAEQIMASDPSVRANIMRGAVYPFTLSLLRGRD